VGENYYKFVHPLFEEQYKEYIKDIVDYAPDVIGFSMYQFSEEPTKWLITELRKQLPNAKIVIGGSNVQHGWF
jgi:hypothetical protein